MLKVSQNRSLQVNRRPAGLQPHHADRARPRLISEAKQRGARLVLGQEKAPWTGQEPMGRPDRLPTTQPGDRGRGPRGGPEAPRRRLLCRASGISPEIYDRFKPVLFNEYKMC